MRYPLLSALVVMCCLPLVSSCSFFRPQSVPPSPAASTPAAAIREAIPGLSKNTAANRNPQYETEEDLLKITTEFQRVEARDTYRFPLPQDVTGANAYKATLKRLDDYQAKHPGAYPVLVAFTRGRAYEGLHAYPQALEAYQRVSQTRHRLKDEATKSAAALDKFQELAERPVSATTPAEYLQVLDEQAADLILVGLPLGRDGRPTVQSERVRSQARQLLAGRSERIEFFDESFTTAEAIHRFAGAADDAHAAAVMLEHYLAARAGGRR